MIITTPMYAIADGLPVRYIREDDGQVLSQYLNLTGGVWVDDFDFVYNVLSGREGDEPTELLKGDLIRMPRRIFEDRVAVILKKRAKKLEISCVDEALRDADKELLVHAAAGAKLGPDFMEQAPTSPNYYEPDYTDMAKASVDAIPASQERAWYKSRGLPVPPQY